MRPAVWLVLVLALPAPAEAARHVTATFYTQTGNTPACGQLRKPYVQVAVSRDLLRHYPCGTRIGVWLARPFAGRWVLTAVVSDTTGPRARDTVDVLVPSYRLAVKAGRIPATLRRLP